MTEAEGGSAAGGVGGGEHRLPGRKRVLEGLGEQWRRKGANLHFTIQAVETNCWHVLKGCACSYLWYGLQENHTEERPGRLLSCQHASFMSNYTTAVTDETGKGGRR